MKKLPSKNVLMLCHDINLDRRVVSQAMALNEKYGVDVHLIALSSHGNDAYEEVSGIKVHRVGLDKITPSNPIYARYNRIQANILDRTNRIANKNPKFARMANAYFKIASYFNQKFYVASLCYVYRNRQLHDPLPFTIALLAKARSIQPGEGDWEVIQVHDLPSLETGVMLKKEFGIPLIYDAHELYPEQVTFSKAQKKICSDAEAKLIKDVDVAITVNQSIAEVMSERYGIVTPAVVTNAVDLPSNFEQSDSGKNVIRERLNLPDSMRILLFQGGLSPHRNIDKVVAAMAKVEVNNLCLVVLGDGPVKPTLLKIAKRKKLLDNKVFFLDAVPQSELLAYSACADAGIIPYPHVDLNSLYCTPNKLFEFIAAKLPIIANESPELNRFVSLNGFGETADLNSVRSIASSINSKFEDHRFFLTAKNNLHKNGRHFLWENEKIGYLTLLSKYF